MRRTSTLSAHRAKQPHAITPRQSQGVVSLAVRRAHGHKVRADPTQLATFMADAFADPVGILICRCCDRRRFAGCLEPIGVKLGNAGHHAVITAKDHFRRSICPLHSECFGGSAFAEESDDLSPTLSLLSDRRQDLRHVLSAQSTPG